jgi:uncharacterized OsmC-like protein
MAEIVVVRMQRTFEADFLAADTEAPEVEQRELRPAHAIHELTPYAMLLASLGSCTAILLHSYAQNHGVDLQEVEIKATYDRAFAADCQNCQDIDEYAEQIEATIAFRGRLSDAERKKLLAISRHCPIHKILHDGIQTQFLEAEP